MEKRIVNPWKWQDARNYVQAVEVKNVQSTLYCAGQAAVSAEGESSTADMRMQLLEAIQNLEQVIAQAGYELNNIVRLNVYTTSNEEFMPCFEVLQTWIANNGIKQVTTLFEVRSLFETLKVELEATAVK